MLNVECFFRFMVPMGIQFWKSPLPVTVAQPSRLRVLAASRRQFGKRAPGRCPNPQAGRLRYFAVHEQALGTMEPAIGAPVSDPASWQAIASNEPRRCSALRFMERAGVMQTPLGPPFVPLSSKVSAARANFSFSSSSSSSSSLCCFGCSINRAVFSAFLVVKHLCSFVSGADHRLCG